MRIKWNGDNERYRRFCYGCGHYLLDWLGDEAKKTDKSHLPLLEL